MKLFPSIAILLFLFAIIAPLNAAAQTGYVYDPAKEGYVYDYSKIGQECGYKKISDGAVACPSGYRCQDRGKLGTYAEKSCPDNMPSCDYIPGVGKAMCQPRDASSFFKCPDGKEIIIQMTYPGTIVCAPKEMGSGRPKENQNPGAEQSSASSPPYNPENTPAIYVNGASAPQQLPPSAAQTQPTASANEPPPPPKDAVKGAMTEDKGIAGNAIDWIYGGMDWFAKLFSGGKK